MADIEATGVEAGAAAAAASSQAPRNIVIFSDGTGQDGGMRPEQRMSNIFKLYRASRVSPDNDIDPSEQVVFYDPGLGTDSDATGLTALKRTITKTLSSATGRGITINIADCYEFIINHYRPGDRIFLFGFSRGAYTIRCVANVLWLCGVPTKTPEGPLPHFRACVRDIAKEGVLGVYEHGAGHPREKYEAERNELARRFRRKYGSGTDEEANAAPYFIGAFDTVASLGAKGPFRWALFAALIAGVVAVAAGVGVAARLLFGLPFWAVAPGAAAVIALYAGYRYLRTSLKVMHDPPQGGKVSRHIAQWSGKNFDEQLSGTVTYARHAISLDENRADFRRLPWNNGKWKREKTEGRPEPFVQLWFAGNHSDIGGSYPEEESRLSDIALDWMTAEATSLPHPLCLNRRRLHCFPSADGLQHDEVVGMSDTIRGRTPSFLHWATKGLTWGRATRDPKPDSPVHPSVEERFRLDLAHYQGGAGAYRPEALRRHDKFRDLYG